MKKYLIIGLGNPGLEYINTKHNIGFNVIDKLCEHLNITLDKDLSNGIFTKIIIDEKEIFIAKPMTFMNLSGEFVKRIIQFYKIDISNTIIVYDDIDTEIGKIRIREKGSSGGQNGIKNIINQLGTENIKRIRVGIGRPTKNQQLANYVLSKFKNEYLDKVNYSIERAKNACLDFINIDFNKLLSLYN